MKRGGGASVQTRCRQARFVEFQQRVKMRSGDSPSDLRVWMGVTRVQQPTQQPVAAFRGGESLGKQAVHMQIARNTSKTIAEAVKATMRNKVGSGKSNNLFICRINK